MTLESLPVSATAAERGLPGDILTTRGRCVQPSVLLNSVWCCGNCDSRSALRFGWKATLCRIDVIPIDSRRELHDCEQRQYTAYCDSETGVSLQKKCV